VVTRAVPPDAIVGANPATVLKMRFEPAIVERLLAIAWWEWPVEKITRNLDALRRTDLARLEAAR
jgi:virginiamycin A acetyltransferase